MLRANQQCNQGCAPLLRPALEALRASAPLLEAAYGDLVAAGAVQRGAALPEDPAAARALAAKLAEHIAGGARLRARAQRASQPRAEEEEEEAGHASGSAAGGDASASTREAARPPVARSWREAAPAWPEVASPWAVAPPRAGLELLDRLRFQKTRGLIRVRGLAAQMHRLTSSSSLSAAVSDAAGLWPVGLGRLDGRLSVHPDACLLTHSPPDALRVLGPPAEPRPREAGPHGAAQSGAAEPSSAAEATTAQGPTESSPMPTRHGFGIFGFRRPAQVRSGGRRRSPAGRAPALQQRAPPRHTSEDTSAWEGGDPLRNAAVALALQAEIRAALACAACDGPLHAAWRRAGSEREASQLLRLRVCTGALLLFAALRAPLPTWEELDAGNFQLPPGDGPAAPRKVLLPDGVCASGLLPVFHALATPSGAAVAPAASRTFHVSAPHAMLEDGQLRSVLTERGPGGSRVWAAGALPALLAAGALEEAHRQRPEWSTSKGLWQPDARVFLPLCCAFRLAVGLECVRAWRGFFPAGREPVVADLLPFLAGARTQVAQLPVQLRDAADGGSRGLYVAPKVLPSAPGTPGFDPDFDCWSAAARGAGVPLQDFAAWVGQLPEQCLVYSSCRSGAGDVYLRLRGAVVVVSFVARAAPLYGRDVFERYRGAVGRPEWWGVGLVSHVLLPKVRSCRASRPGRGL
ncbi:unnamed protein product [Prorocentrum cordatum]|uniref:Uncharacterized protein n=1 Tax=Prorocentrum cordatum TaxID=2364126 RepID=A0ABN9PIZ1_9DINO|nr:unnamed protein product [Polarella glacialis]